MRPTTPLLLLALFGPAAAQDVRTIAEFDGSPIEKWDMVGEWSIERSKALVRSGSGALRMLLGPPNLSPGLRVRPPALSQKGYRTLHFEVFNPNQKVVTLHIRLDDTETRGREPEMFRRHERLRPGWTSVALDLLALRTQSGARMLDAENLSRLILWVAGPKEPFYLILDHLRFQRPEGSGDEDLPAVLRLFRRQFTPLTGYGDRQRLILGLRGVDAPERCKLLASRVLGPEKDARLIRDAIFVLSDTRHTDAVEEAIAQSREAKGWARWRWLQALGSVAHPAARAELFAVARTARASTDRIAALRALARPQDDEVVPLCAADGEGAWQLRAAKVRGLRTIAAGDAFPALVGHLKDSLPRVRYDAQEGLVTLAEGRDFGDAAGLWLDWWKAKQEGRAISNAGHGVPIGRYGSYYGIPLLPGRVCFIIDVSGSMSAELSASCLAYVKRQKQLRNQKINTRLDLAKAELVRALQELDRKSAFQVIWYASHVHQWSRDGARRAGAVNKSDAIGRVIGLSANGSTNIHGALLAAYYPQRQAPFRWSFEGSVDTIFLLSDGDPTVGEIVDVPHLVCDIREHDRVRMIRINTIGMGRANSPLLRQLAEHTGGTYVDLAK